METLPSGWACVPASAPISFLSSQSHMYFSPAYALLAMHGFKVRLSRISLLRLRLCIRVSKDPCAMYGDGQGHVLGMPLVPNACSNSINLDSQPLALVAGRFKSAMNSPSRFWCVAPRAPTSWCKKGGFGAKTQAVHIRSL